MYATKPVSKPALLLWLSCYFSLFTYQSCCDTGMMPSLPIAVMMRLAATMGWLLYRGWSGSKLFIFTYPELCIYTPSAK